MLHLLGPPSATLGGNVRHLTDGHARILGYLAFNPGEHDRRFVASTLWPDAGGERAAGNLRAQLWRLRRDGIGLVDSDGHLLSLGDGVLVDVQLLDDWATRLIAGIPTAIDLAWVPRNIDTAEILPGFSDEWIEMERQRLQQRMLHAVECLSREFRLAGRFAEALESALVVCQTDPLRESAQETLIETYLSEGNPLLAQRSFAEYRDLVMDELGVEPSPALAQRLDSFLRGEDR
ncbi:AfsR/SARP family transcriptional regulator [Paeniglutamicibacter psychrophenolicus]|uniref:AfsR/SARP family transcriptional regulator n=1 Tax=Paeniglutamicibacter psychrophenolicus TaxID=257454 RepID=UPI0027811D19|nr:BTAD domain-containing putative transcriptional regulator [Paeniglutamicibacter psychrophenolicus]MDQ0094565.1 DNA-binding SARP family transcriptional activator [Paeniglutamicibacter psychrophenolicus]